MVLYQFKIFNDFLMIVLTWMNTQDLFSHVFIQSFVRLIEVNERDCFAVYVRIKGRSLQFSLLFFPPHSSLKYCKSTYGELNIKEQDRGLSVKFLPCFRTVTPTFESVRTFRFPSHITYAGSSFRLPLCESRGFSVAGKHGMSSVYNSQRKRLLATALY